MIILITGASHTGKTLLAQRMLETYQYPYLSIDHLKMGLIRSGITTLTPEDDEALTDYLWPIVREILKTAIENRQNLIVEGCYVPPDWRKDFDETYLPSIRFVCLAMTEDYIASHFDEIIGHESEIETRLFEADCTAEELKADNRRYIDRFGRAGEQIVLIEEDYKSALQRLLLDCRGKAEKESEGCSMKLIEPTLEYCQQIRAYRKEFLDCGDSMDGTGLRHIADPEAWVERSRLYRDPAHVPEGLVPATQYIFVREEDPKIVGMLQIRHVLNDYLAKYAGHIGYSVAPSERRKGYATQMLRSALPKCRELGLDKVLITCTDHNIGSRKTILANGGVYESTVYEPDKKVWLEKYWIDLSD